MGGAVSELRAEIHAHVLLAQRYPTLLEPVLAAVQFFLRTAEAGEGADPAHRLEDPATDLAIAERQRLLVEQASTELELLAEDPAVARALLLAVRDWRVLQPSPAVDPLPRWFDPPWQRGERRSRPMPRPVLVPDDEVPRFRTAALRASVRCLRLLARCADGREQLSAADVPALLHRAAADCPLDDFVQTDVQAIFRAVFGGDGAVRLIALSGAAATTDAMRENRESAIVQLAGVRRLCQLLADAKGADAKDVERELLAQIDACGAVSLAVDALARFDVDGYLALYVHVSRFIAYVADHERNAKLAGQAGGVQGCIQLLFRARELHRESKARAKAEAARRAMEEAHERGDWSDSHSRSAAVALAAPAAPPPPLPLTIDAQGNVSAASGVAALSAVDLTPAEAAQQAIWALDLLARLDFNVSLMKLHRLKYLLEEIRLDPDAKDIGDALVITRRLRLIRWDAVSLPSSSSPPKAAQRDQLIDSAKHKY